MGPSGPAPAVDRYTYGEWTLRETRERLRALTFGDNTQLVIASIGDSWTHYAGRWCGPTAQGLKAAYGDAGPGWTGFGFGGPGGQYVNGNVANPTCAPSFLNASDWNYSGYNASASPDIASLTSAVPGTGVLVSNGPAGCSAVKLFAVGTADGLVRYRWNGGAWTELSVTGSGLLVSPLAGLPAAAWTLEVEVVSGTVTLLGADVQKAARGVRWHKIAGTGSSALHWSRVPAAGWRDGLAALDPRLVTILLGTNDQFQYDAVAFKGYIQELITRVRTAVPAADILLIAPAENLAGNAWPMSTYADALYELAVANDCAYLDLQYVFGDNPADYAAGSSRPWFSADGIHPDPLTGGRAITDAVLRFLVPPI